MTALYCPTTMEIDMTDNSNFDRKIDGVADAVAVTAIMAVVVLTMYIWLSGMPT